MRNVPITSFEATLILGGKTADQYLPMTSLVPDRQFVVPAMPIRCRVSIEEFECDMRASKNGELVGGGNG